MKVQQLNIKQQRIFCFIKQTGLSYDYSATLLTIPISAYKYIIIHLY